jgi:Tol biopolymer transport system component
VIDEREIVRRAVEGVTPPGPAFDRLLRRRDRHQRNQRIAAGIVGIAVALAVLVGGVSLLRSSPRPATTVSPAPDLPRLLQPGEFLDQDTLAWGSQLVAVDRQTGKRRALVNCAISCQQSVFAVHHVLSADGRWLAYEVCTDLACQSLWVTNALGEWQQVSQTCPDHCPPWAWSPQGATLAAVEGGDDSTLFTFDPLNGHRTTMASVGDYISALAWSPDGTRIAFATKALHVLDLESGELTVLADFAGYPYSLAWSPDGTQLLVDEFGARSRITVLNVDGTDARVLVDQGGLPGPAHPAWSPDGTRIAYSATVTGTLGTRCCHLSLEVWVVGTDGSDPTRLFQGECCISDYEGPMWSPDGDRIGFTDDVDVESGTWLVVNADGTGSPEQVDESEVQW